jgi:hypothetical protein
MDSQKFLKPAYPDLIIRDPYQNMAIVPKEGALKDWRGKAGKYWRRRVKDGSMIIIEPSIKEEMIKEKDYEVKEGKNKFNGRKK